MVALKGQDWVYVVYDADGSCLYVGRTNHPAGRFAGHKRKAEWWTRAVRVTWKQFDDPEARLIEELRPEFNQHRAAA
jgi:predicted GIY-YIG superfamily endonuclease